MFSTTYNYLFSVLHIFVNLWDIRCQLWTTGMQLQFYGQAHILNVCNQLTNPWEAYTCSPSHGHKRLPIGRSRLRRSPPVPRMVTRPPPPPPHQSAAAAPIRRALSKQQFWFVAPTDFFVLPCSKWFLQTRVERRLMQLQQYISLFSTLQLTSGTIQCSKWNASNLTTLK